MEVSADGHRSISLIIPQFGASQANIHASLSIPETKREELESPKLKNQLKLPGTPRLDEVNHSVTLKLERSLKRNDTITVI